MVKYSATLDQRFSALADPTRRAILDRLSTGEAAVSKIAAGFDMSLPAVMKHISVLEGAGLVRCRKSGRVRHCRIETKAVENTLHWLQSRHAVWQRRLDSLGEVVKGESKR
ncbi:MAG: metalloregulator ArsR/SmtB family transcription factor [Actinobacteria bacterium]|nr:metalloregulator ArsR/SmtB family transcription factor [Actinomycetota bacterium]